MRVGEVEAGLDPLLDERAGQRLVDVEGVAIAAELAGRPRAHVHRQRRHRVQEKPLDVVAGDQRNHVRARRRQPPLDLGQRGVHAQHQRAVLGGRPHQELRRVRQGEGGDERHQPLRRLRGCCPWLSLSAPVRKCFSLWRSQSLAAF